MSSKKAWLKRIIYFDMDGNEIFEQSIPLDAIENKDFTTQETADEMEILYWGNAVVVTRYGPFNQAEAWSTETKLFVRDKMTGYILAFDPTMLTMEKG